MFSHHAMLYKRLKYHCLLCGAVMSTESSLCGCVEAKFLCLGCKFLVYYRHEELCKRGGYSYTAVVFWVICIALALVQWYHLSFTPLWGG